MLAGATNEFVARVKGASKSAENLSKSYDMTSETLQKDANASVQLFEQHQKCRVTMRPIFPILTKKPLIS